MPQATLSLVHNIIFCLSILHYHRHVCGLLVFFLTLLVLGEQVAVCVTGYRATNYEVCKVAVIQLACMARPSSTVPYDYINRRFRCHGLSVYPV